MAATNHMDGHYLLKSLEAAVAQRVARLTRHQTLARSTSTLGRAVTHAGPTVLLVEDVIAAATSAPAAYRWPADVGSRPPGQLGGLVVRGPDLHVRRCLRRRRWV